jgi:tape measure domain-containing protein
MASIGDLVATLGVNSSMWSRGLQAASGDLKSFGNIAQIALGNIAANAVSRLSSMASGAVSSMFKLAAAAESTQISFGVMLGSGEAATQMLSQLRSFAASTPLEFGDLQNSARTLLSFGVAADQIMPTLQMLGDVSGGDAQRFQALSLAFAQMSATGRLMGQDLLQMVNAGFNPLQVIAEKTGVSLAELKKRMENGEISSQMVAEAFAIATSEGGKFFGMLEKRSKTTEGLWSTASDNIKLSLTGLGDAMIEAFDVKGMLDKAATWLSRVANYISENKKFAVELAKALGYTAAAFSILIAATALYALKAQIAAAATIFLKAASGPAGWLAIAAGIAAATAGISAMGYAMDVASKDAQKLVSSMDEVSSPGNAASKRSRPDHWFMTDDWPSRVEAATKVMQQAAAGGGIDKLKADLYSLSEALSVLATDSARSGASLEQLIGQHGTAQWNVIDKFSGFSDRLKTVNDQLRVMKGITTESAIELERMAEAMVPADKLAQLKAAFDELDTLKRQQEEMNAANDIAVRNADIRKRMMDGNATGSTAVGAAQRGSSEAVSAVLRAMRGDGDNEKKQVEELQNLNEQFAIVVDHTRQMAEGRGGVVVAAGGGVP